MLIKNRIKLARVEKNLTQSELAEKVGITRQSIGLIEAGKYNPSLKVCMDLAKVLDKTLDQLFWVEDEEVILLNHEMVLITDIGSTTTKGLLLKKEKNKYVFAASADVPTTVEKPVEDVKIGVRNVLKKIEELTNLNLTKNNKPKIPYITTSSAGGGLQIMVFGLSSIITGKMAEMTAYGAGGVILRTFSIDDKIRNLDKIRLIRELHPDMILMSGGYDNGAISGIVRLAETLSLANPEPKFKQSEKIPLVFCGNKDAVHFIENILSKNFEMHTTENVVNTPKPAKEKIHELFMENVMERAPGYSDLKKWTETDIIPTPSGVENILRLYGEKEKKNIVICDIGGATTDIFSNIMGDYKRTVAANIGMSFSISNILANSGIENLMKHLPNSFKEDDVRNYISNKMLNPVYTPVNSCEKNLEHICAAEGLRLAWQQHLNLNFSVNRINKIEWLTSKKNKYQDPFQKVFSDDTEEYLFQISHIDMIIGAGGVLSHVSDSDEALRIITEGFLPAGITKIAIDRNFKSPHLGVLSNLNEETALELFETECLQEIGYAAAPSGKIKEGKPAVEITNLNTGEKEILKGGDVVYFKSGGKFRIKTYKNIFLHLEEDSDEADLCTDLPILFDIRGREEFFTGKPLTEYGIKEFEVKNEEFKTEVVKGVKEISSGDFRVKRLLPYEGDIFVNEGDTVQPDTVIGENKFGPPRIFIVDVRKFIGYDNDLTDSEIYDGITVRVGDHVEINQRILNIDNGIMGKSFYVNSPVMGKVIQVEKSGFIIMREIQDYALKPVRINISDKLDIPPKKVAGHMRFKIGDFVEKGHLLALKTHKGGFFEDLKTEYLKQSSAFLDSEADVVKAPATGIVTEIDEKKGIVTIHYDKKPIPLKSFVKGKVNKIYKELGVEILGSGEELYGIIGFGGENYGELKIINSVDDLTEESKGKIAVSFKSIDSGFLYEADKIGVSGIIAPSVHNRDWVEFYKEEIGVALTGDEQIHFTLILTEGFGRFDMNEDYIRYFTEKEGKMGSITGRTQIRAGVTRPMMIIND